MNNFKKLLSEKNKLIIDTEALEVAYDKFQGSIYKQDKTLAKKIHDRMNAVWLVIEKAQKENGK